MEQGAVGERRGGLSPSEAFSRVVAAAEHRVVEAASQYVSLLTAPGWSHLGAGGGEAIDPAICKIVGHDNYVITGTSMHMPGLAGLEITGDRNIVFMGAWTRYQRLRVTITGDDNIVFIGWSSSGGDVHVVASGRERLVMIGDECMLSSPTTIGTQTELSVIDETGAPVPDRMLGPQPGFRARTIVDDRIWSGRDISISAGVHVGRGAVVGQCAIVTQDVPENAIVAGAPATVLRSGIIFSRAIEADSLSGADEMRRKSVVTRRRSQLVLHDKDRHPSPVLHASIERPPPGASPAALQRAVLDAATATALTARLNETTRAERPMVTAEALVGAPHDGEPGFDSVGDITYRSRRASGRNNAIVAEAGARAVGLTLSMRGSNNIIYIAADAVLHRTAIDVSGDDNVVYVGRGATVDDHVIVLVDGNGATFTLGEDCAIGVGVVLANADGAMIFDEDGDRLIADTDVRIGDHVAIGAYARVHNGVQVGDGAVIAAGAWASGVLAGGGLYAGSPAVMASPAVTWRRDGSGL